MMTRRQFVKRGALWVAAASLGERILLAAPTLVAHIAAQTPDGGSAFSTGPINTTGATVLVIGFASFPGNGCTISDTLMNTWTPLTSYADPSNTRSVQIFYAANPTVGNDVFSVSANSFGTICVAAFSGVPTVSPFDAGKDSGGPSSSNFVSPGALTASGDGYLYVTACETSDVAASPLAINGSFVITDQIAENPAPDQRGCVLAYKVVSPIASINPTWTYSNSVFQNNAASMAIFKASASGAAAHIGVIIQ